MGAGHQRDEQHQRHHYHLYYYAQRKGTITASTGTTLSATGFTGNAPKDLFQNAMTGTISKTFTGVTSTETYTFDVFQSPETNVYNISSKNDLASLAALVNRVGNDCSGKTFRQTQDITCGYDYTPIGYYVSNSDNAYFRGTYDGQGHTVSDINISRTGDSQADGYMGLFGYIFNGSIVKNVVLASSTFTGYNYIGGIVGNNYGTVENCRVESTVTIRAGANDASYHGGIAGINNGTIRGCISAATVSRNSKSNCTEYGGIAGRNASYSTVKDCLYTGTSVDAYSLKGAIVGYKEGGTLTNNYYTAINLGGVNSSDLDGARRARTVSLGEGVTINGTETTYDVSGLTAIATTALSYNGTIYSGESQTLTLVYADGSETFTMPAMDVIPLLNGFDNSSAISANRGSGKNVILTGRTLYKDGSWNTLCLPFGVTVSGSVLDGDNVTVMELNGSTSGLDASGLLTINFTPVTSGVLTAGKPYIIKWDNTGADIVNPVFNGVTIDGTDPATKAVAFSNYFGDDGQFVGSYSPLPITDENIDKIIYLGSNNTLGYATSTGRTLRSMRAHFVVPTTTTSHARAMTRAIVNFGDDESTGIVSLTTESADRTAEGWHTLDGRKLSGKPSQHGIYIENGKKVIIK